MPEITLMHSHGRESLRVPRGKLDLGLSGKDAQPPRVMRAFAIYIGLALILAAAIILLFVRSSSERTSKTVVSDQTELVASSVVPNLLDSEDWTKPLAEDKVAKIDAAVNQSLLDEKALRVRFFTPDGKVLYSSENSEIGNRIDHSEELRRVIDGAKSAEVTTINEGGRDIRVIQAYSPIGYSGSPAPSGILAIYHDYGMAAGSIREQAIPLAGFIILIFLLVYAALLPLLRRTTKQIAYSNDELRKRADDLNETLMQRAEIEQRLRESIGKLESSEHALALSQEETIMRLSIAVETRDQETGDHIERMGRYCALLAEKSGWDEQRCELLRIAAPLHDVGKIAIPDAILLKPGGLTDQERTEMERHAEIGYEILAGSDSPLLDLAAHIALSHHEHWDGMGYPNGLREEEIPIEGRMAAIADVFDALTSDRVYREAMSAEKALSIMAEGRGSHFDPTLLDLFFDSIVEVLMIRDGQVEEQRKRRQANLSARRRQRQVLPVDDVVNASGEDDSKSRSMVG